MKHSSSSFSLGTRYNVRILTGFAVALIAVAVGGLTAYRSIGNLVSTGDRTAHLQLVIGHLETLRSLLSDAETRERDYLINGDLKSLELYRSARAKIGRQVHLLEALTHDADGQRQRLTALKPLIAARLAALQDSISVRTQMGSQAALEMARSVRKHSSMDDIGGRIDTLIGEERRLAQPKPAWIFTPGSGIKIILAACFVGLAVLSLMAFYIFRLLTALRIRLADLSESNTALRTRSRFMDAVFDGMDEGVVVLDRDMKVVRSNPVAEKLLRASKSQLADDLRAELEPSSSAGDGLRLALEHLQTTLSQVQGPETNGITISGRERPSGISVAATAKVLRDDSGALQGGLLRFRDVTERERMERQLQANEASLIGLFHYGLEAAFITTLEDSFYLAANEGFLRMCGYLHDEILGRTIDEMNVFKNRSEPTKALKQLRIGQIVRDRVVYLRTRSGRTFSATLSAMPIEIGGQACGLFAFSNLTPQRVEWNIRPPWMIRRLFR